MKNAVMTIWLVILLGLVGWASCEDDLTEDGGSSDGDSDSDTDGDADSDADGDGDGTSQAQLISMTCDMVAECDSSTYEMLGGESGCETSISMYLFSDCENYDAQVATSCANAVESVGCDSFMDMLLNEDFPPQCDELCSP